MRLSDTHSDSELMYLLDEWQDNGGRMISLLWREESAKTNLKQVASHRIGNDQKVVAEQLCNTKSVQLQLIVIYNYKYRLVWTHVRSDPAE